MFIPIHTFVDTNTLITIAPEYNTTKHFAIKISGVALAWVSKEDLACAIFHNHPDGVLCPECWKESVRGVNMAALGRHW